VQIQQRSGVKMGCRLLDNGDDGAPLRCEPNTLLDKLIEKLSPRHSRRHDGSSLTGCEGVANRAEEKEAPPRRLANATESHRMKQRKTYRISLIQYYEQQTIVVNANRKSFATGAEGDRRNGRLCTLPSGIAGRLRSATEVTGIRILDALSIGSPLFTPCYWR
jgi:hypothetical protein